MMIWLAASVHAMKLKLSVLWTPGKIITRVDDEVVSYQRPPFVIEVSDRWRYESGALGEQFFQQWDYSFLRREVRSLTSVYVRPLPLWIAHVVGQHSYRVLWTGIGWALNHGLLRCDVPEGVEVRIRDLRPWPMRGYRRR